MRLVIISGLSGSGKSVALHLLEDLGFYCIDNIPVGLLRSFVDEILLEKDGSYTDVGVGLDARNRPSDIQQLPALLKKLKDDGVECELIFLQASDDVLLTRFSETRRRHPLSSETVSLREAIAKERALLGPIIDAADLIVDTTRTTAYALREMIRERIGKKKPSTMSILIESFGYKHGLPPDADFVFDVRCLPNPYWETQLRPLTGLDDEVIAFLDAQPAVQEMVDDITRFLERWIPLYQRFQRSYLTVAIGCTGGQHRSVYVAEAVAKRLRAVHESIQTRHHELP
ncbi:MAG: RNase adapter RapZ [Gammaproteobacteria bacterium]|nr:RNase adapter RapZ [Gammaproteobacteria bacterium]